MSYSFAATWAYCWLAVIGLFSFVGIATRMPLPDMPWPLVIGGLVGAWIVGPIVINSFWR